MNYEQLMKVKVNNKEKFILKENGTLMGTIKVRCE